MAKIRDDIDATSTELTLEFCKSVFHRKTWTTLRNQSVGVVEGMQALWAKVEIVTIGTGGGSVTHIDAEGGIHVGPRSAGSSLEPACYGRGGEKPTVPDLQVVLGRLDRSWRSAAT
ncbi:hydantoinase/oxoprolinase family protein [Methylobacterium radiodurans]|uniref:hydantoinase/oxoprolinase family protein n=1 Tax=Methylobacterium radiodurans TaxID=2202828 RepID=UPI00194EDD21|nr:hydantoinase/oxoprolinase family protein [Methylobacterium radiodurans]